jgi:hypothetical protein
MQSKILAAAVALAMPFPVRGAEPGPEIGLRTGFSLPFGSLAQNSGSLSDGFTGFVPIGAELGWRFTPNLYVGAAFSYAFGLTKNCPPGDSCSGHDIGLGIDLRYHVQPDERIDPWVGVGAGYEWLGLSETSAGSTTDLRLDGFEFVHAEVGADFVASRNVRVGPFLQFAVGQYKGANASSGGTSFSADIANKTLHEFLTFGARLRFLL